MKITNNSIGIYFIKNKTNQKIYIGQSRRVRARLRRHIRELKDKKHSNPKLQNAWDEYGEDSFEVGLLEECTLEELDNREQYHLDTADKELLYNCHTKVGQVPNALLTLGREKFIQKVNEGIERRKNKVGLSKEEKEAKKNACAKLGLGRKERSDKGKKRTGKPREKLSLEVRKQNPNLAPYRFISPTGELVEGKGVKIFCEENNLNSKKIWELRKGIGVSHKGWKLVPEDAAKFRTPKVKKEKSERSKLLKQKYLDKQEKINKGENPYPQVVSPNGEVFSVEPSLKGFCREHNLTACTFSALLSQKSWNRGNPLNSHKGWKLLK